MATHVANFATPIPGGTGNFTAFPSAPSLSGDNLAFIGKGNGGAQGVYARIGAISPPRIALQFRNLPSIMPALFRLSGPACGSHRQPGHQPPGPFGLLVGVLW